MIYWSVWRVYFFDFHVFYVRAEDECVLNRRLCTTDWIHVFYICTGLTDTLKPTEPNRTSKHVRRQWKHSKYEDDNTISRTGYSSSTSSIERLFGGKTTRALVYMEFRILSVCLLCDTVACAVLTIQCDGNIVFHPHGTKSCLSNVLRRCDTPSKHTFNQWIGFCFFRRLTLCHTRCSVVYVVRYDKTGDMRCALVYWAAAFDFYSVHCIYCASLRPMIMIMTLLNGFGCAVTKQCLCWACTISVFFCAALCRIHPFDKLHVVSTDVTCHLEHVTLNFFLNRLKWMAKLIRRFHWNSFNYDFGYSNLE